MLCSHRSRDLSEHLGKVGEPGGVTGVPITEIWGLGGERPGGSVSISLLSRAAGADSSSQENEPEEKPGAELSLSLDNCHRLFKPSRAEGLRLTLPAEVALPLPRGCSARSLTGQGSQNHRVTGWEETPRIIESNQP